MTIYELLTAHEGLRLKPYTDTVGKLTIGVGRNLSDNGISKAEAEAMLQSDVKGVIADLTKNLPYFDDLNTARQAVLVDMCFNMGWPTLSQFKTTLGYVANGSYDKAAEAMLQSHWAQQVGQRSQTLATMMRTGTW